MRDPIENQDGWVQTEWGDFHSGKLTQKTTPSVCNARVPEPPPLRIGREDGGRFPVQKRRRKAEEGRKTKKGRY